ncbi:N-acetylglucosamine kinase [Glycomyces salinus]|uniref:N-acetylglucosamine kinase n=1 Tax=Glycomyces salinus TaxID=980294 RepID=UPI0018EB7D30|nr:BadF/BadG/BcrA/BcrD ATPase family protein [Glycomyces salinus]
MTSPLFLGIDAGGTRTRAVLADGDGRILGTGESGAANVVGPEQDKAILRMGEAAAAARGPIGPERIGAVCAGAAGLLALPGSGEMLGRELGAVLGTDCPVSFIGDAATAFAAGTAEPDGAVVIGGTGASAFAIRSHTAIASRADGYGWLLGDAGSGFWLGREAVAATLRHLDGHGPGGRMVQAVIADLSPSARTSGAVVGRCMADSPVRLARFAPVVCEAADGGDELAGSIVDRAVGHLAETARSVAEPGLPLVLAGGLLSADTPLARGVRERLAAERPDAPMPTGAQPVRGAAWLAAGALEPDPEARRRLHARLMGA